MVTIQIYAAVNPQISYHVDKLKLLAKFGIEIGTHLILESTVHNMIFVQSDIRSQKYELLPEQSCYAHNK
jgi:hypothetical protein